MSKPPLKFLLDTLARGVVTSLLALAALTFGDLPALVVSIHVTLAFVLGKSWLGALNFGVLQWFGVRLACGWSTTRYPAGDTPGRWWSENAPPRGVPVIWTAMGWICPLTGWWGEYRFLTRRFHSWRLVG